MKVVLLYPPISNVRYPYLSLPCLSAFLKKAGYKPMVKDVNLEAFYHLIPGSGGKVGRGEVDLHSLREARDALMDPTVAEKKKKRARSTLMKVYLTYYKGFEAGTSCDSLEDTLEVAKEGRDDPFESYYEGHLMPWILGVNPALVGISIAYPTQLMHGFRIAFLIKKANPRIHLCMGGPTITKLMDHLTDREELLNAVDSIVLHHGEVSLARLIEAIGDGDSLESIPNVVFKKGGRWYRSAISFSRMDMNTLPPPDFEGFPLSLYLSRNSTLPLITSRGCYWNQCTFCTYRELYKGAFEQRDAALVVGDMAKLHREYGCSHFRFMDDACSPAFLRALARRIIQSGLKVRWSCFARFEAAFMGDLCHLLAEGGCKRLMFGLESYNQRILDLMN